MAKILTITDFQRSADGTVSVEFNDRFGRSEQAARLLEMVENYDFDLDILRFLLLLYLRRNNVAFTQANRANIIGKRITLDLMTPNIIAVSE